MKEQNDSATSNGAEGEQNNVELLQTYQDLLDEITHESDMYVGMHIEEHMARLQDKGAYTAKQIETILFKFNAGENFDGERISPSGKVLLTSVRPLKNGGHVVSISDISALKRHEEKLANALARAESAESDAQKSLDDLNFRTLETDKLSEFGDWLHSCESLQELYVVIKQSLNAIYPGSSGQLFIYSNSRDVLDGVASWGSSRFHEHIKAHDCWSLRRGRLLVFGDGLLRIPCNHVDQNDNSTPESYYCIPLLGRGETLGLLHIDLSEYEPSEHYHRNADFNVDFISSCAEQISLAIANTQMRDELHEQSTRDSLTGLVNRRYFFERFRSEKMKYESSDVKFGIAIFDADNFKQINDVYGHDAGDTVLQKISDVARKFFKDDVVARIGGEEFAVFSTEIEHNHFYEKMEAFRQEVAELELNYFNEQLPSVTVSIGCSMYPKDGVSIVDLLKIADAAMYQSKSAGKNQTIISSKKAA